MRYSHCLSHSHHQDDAFSLIEVLAALVILGSLLAAVVLARGRFIRQSAVARQRMEAVHVADRLLGAWWQDLETLPRGDTGVMGGYRWQTQTEQRDDLDKLNVNLLTLTLQRTKASTTPSISSSGGSGASATSGGGGEPEVLVVRILIPVPSKGDKAKQKPLMSPVNRKAAST